MEEYVGLDVSKEETIFCVMDASGKILAEGKLRSDPESFSEALRAHTLCLKGIVLETGTWSGWLTRGLRGHDLAVDVINARQARAEMKLQHNKTDANDAHLLAEIARTGFYCPVPVNSETAQKHRILIKVRRHLVRLVCQKRDTVNATRGFLGSLGIRFATGSGKLVGRVRAALAKRPDLRPMIEPLLASAEALKIQIKRLGEDVRLTASRLLMAVPGVGPVAALAFAATIDDAGRFAKSRTVGAYFRLTSRRNQSGEMDYSGRISKFGDSLMRSLLYEAANSLLTVVRKAYPIKD